MGMDPLTLMAGSSLVSGLMGANAASSAADTQAGAADRATQSQRAMFDLTSGYEAPFRNLGTAAGYRLSGLLGIPGGGGGASGGAGGGSGAPETADQIRARLAPQFAGSGPQTIDNGAGGGFQVPGSGSAANPTGLDAAVQAAMAQQGGGAGGTAAPGPAGSIDPNDPSFGSLNKSFGLSDFQLDPGIQFQQKYGQQALQNSQAAKTGVLSGGAMKDLMTFNQGLAGTGYQSAYDRYMQNKAFTYGSLKDMMNIGQSAASNTANTGANYASGMANTIVGAGQARAAGDVGVANALSGGIGNAGNAYFLNSLLSGGGGGGGGLKSTGDPLQNYA